MNVFCGIDWAENHHDIAVVDERGQLIVKRRITDDAAGCRELLELLAEQGDSAALPVPVAIETGRGLLVACLRATGRPVYAINPLGVSRYRERHSVARAKSDHADATVLANILRTDAHAHRLLPVDSELAQAIAVLARAGQDATWQRQQVANQLRSLLREYFPAAIEAFHEAKAGLAGVEARTILAAAPTPAMAAKLTKPRLPSRRPPAMLVFTGIKRSTGGAPVTPHPTASAHAPAQHPTSSGAATPPTEVSDEDQRRQTVMSFQDAANTQNWDAYLNLMCAPMRAKFAGTVMDYLKKDRARTGLTTTTITSVSITGDTATANMNSHNEALGSASVSLPLKREEDGWKICQTYP